VLAVNALRNTSRDPVSERFRLLFIASGSSAFLSIAKSHICKGKTMMLSLPRLVPFVTASLLALSSPSTALADEIFVTNGVAINGYDPVAYFTDQKPVKGVEEFSTSYKGATFHFASAAHRDAFVKNPTQYAPQYGGYCAFGTARGYKAPTQPQTFTIVAGKLYLNYNDEVTQTWRSDTGGYIKLADANWNVVRTQPAP
jgi:YHS domain-containing protein